MTRRLLLTLAVLSTSLLPQQGSAEREGNFTIRFEPTAKLQTGPAVPFEIHITNALRQPVAHAKVTLQIETAGGSDVETFAAPEVQAGVYIAKPAFKTAGDWTVFVEASREGMKSARSIKFNVAS